MKKYFLLTVLVSFVFLGLGNYTSALCFNDVDCASGICNKTNGQCINTSTTTTSNIGTVQAGGFCTDPLNCKAGLTCLANKCITDPNAGNNTSSLQSCIESDPLSCLSGTCIGGKCLTQPLKTDCSSCRKLSTPDDFAKGCNASSEDYSACSDGKYCCPKVAGTKCTNGSLAFKDHAIVGVGGVGCTCEKGYKRVDNECKSCSAKGVCCGVELNTSIPFIGKCIESESTYQSPDEKSVTGETAFPVLMSSLAKILVTVILIVSFVLIILGGIMIATGNPSGKKMIIKVVVGIALLGASGVILRLINPNFFG